ITDQLDTSVIDVATFGLGSIIFGEVTLTPPSGTMHYATSVDLRPGRNLIVRVTAGIDLTTGLATWRLTSIDPATGNPPNDPLAGFLPPNKIPPEGDGRVS